MWVGKMAAQWVKNTCHTNMRTGVWVLSTFIERLSSFGGLPVVPDYEAEGRNSQGQAGQLD